MRSRAFALDASRDESGKHARVRSHVRNSLQGESQPQQLYLPRPRPQPAPTSSTTSYSLPAPGESRRTYLGVFSLVSRRGLCGSDSLRARVFSRR